MSNTERLNLEHVFECNNGAKKLEEMSRKMAEQSKLAASQINNIAASFEKLQEQFRTTSEQMKELTRPVNPIGRDTFFDKTVSDESINENTNVEDIKNVA